MSSFGEAEDPRRRLLIGALVGSTLTSWGAAGQAYAMSMFGGVPHKLPPDQSVFSIDGTCTINGESATMKSRIAPGDTIVTGPRSQFIFVVGDTALLMRDNTQLLLDKSINVDTPVSLNLSMGKMLSVFAPGRPVRIDTLTAVIGIHGTGLYVETDPQQTYFCTCFGTTDVVAKDDPQSRTTVVSAHHDRPLFIVAGNKSPGNSIRNAPFVNHTDQELAVIETIAGRVLPPSFPKFDSLYNRERGRAYR